METKFQIIALYGVIDIIKTLSLGPGTDREFFLLSPYTRERLAWLSCLACVDKKWVLIS